jgi:hypothetical protein
MASKAARQEPTRRGYHTGERVEAEDTIPRRCVLFEKTQGLTGIFQRKSMLGHNPAPRAIKEVQRVPKPRGETASA